MCVCVCVIVRDRVCVHSNYQQLCDWSAFNEGRLWSLLMMWIIKIRKIMIKNIISLYTVFSCLLISMISIFIGHNKNKSCSSGWIHLFINFLLTLMNLNPVYCNAHINVFYSKTNSLFWMPYIKLQSCVILYSTMITQKWSVF